MGAGLWGMVGRDTTELLEMEELGEMRMKFKLQFQIKQLLVEGRIGSEGQKRWTKYRIKT